MLVVPPLGIARVLPLAAVAPKDTVGVFKPTAATIRDAVARPNALRRVI
jgi:hypothetical protein